MKKHTCHLDLHQRSRHVTIGQRNWVRKLLDNQNEKLLDKRNSSNQPIPNPIRDRSGQLGITRDVISVHACSSENSKSLNVEQTHDRLGQPGKDTVAVQDDPEVYHEAETLNTDNETIRERI